VFSELLIREKNGCSKHNPGIGDIKYVKDNQVGKIVNTNFHCSLFGSHTSFSVGWVRKITVFSPYYKI
jgi:hypothetical protein